MLLYDKRNPRMVKTVEVFKQNGGDILLDAVCRKQNYVVDFFEADKSFKRKWSADITPREKIVHLNAHKRTEEDMALALAKALAFEKAYQDNQTENHDPKFGNKVIKSYEENIDSFAKKSDSFKDYTQDYLYTRPMVNGLKGHKANTPRWRGSMKRIKNFSKIAVE